MASKFTHLHVHSQYSLLDGLPKIEELLDYVKEHNMDSVALTDHGVLYGAVEFYKKAKRAGIKPIIGVEMYMAKDKMTQRRPNIDNKRYHLILLAKNEIGYRNLVKLVTKAHLEGFYYKPRIDEQLLFKHSEGLIAMTACLQGKIPRLIIAGKTEEAEKMALKYQEVFGKDSFYLEIQHHPNIPEQAKVNKALIALSKKSGIPLVATNDCHYLRPEDAEAQDILMLINTAAKPDDPSRLTMKQDDFSMTPPKDMLEQFKDTPSAIENTQKIAELCNFEFSLGKVQLPYFTVPNGKTPDQELRHLCENHLKQKEKQFKNKKAAQERLDYELGVIQKTGFASYFLIVADFVDWAKKNKIVVGPGRGCFLPGTKILLDKGRQKNIEEIKHGDRIITHTGRHRKVKKTLCYETDEEIAIVNSKMSTFELRLTKDHKVLAARHQMCSVKGMKPTICKPTCNRPCKKNLWKYYKLEWIEAQNLEKNDFLAYPIPKLRRINIKFDLLKCNHLDPHLKGDDKYVWYEIGTNKLVPKRVKRFIKLDEKLAKLLGFYIAEGWSRTQRSLGLGTVGFGFHKDEEEYITEVRKLLKEIFGIESSLKFHQTKNSCQVFGYSRIVAKFFERLCGKYAQNKHIPYQIFESNDKIITSLLTSLFKGDGSNKCLMRLSFDSTSFGLISQVKMLLAQLGIMSSIKDREYKQRNWHPSYKLTISGKQLFKFNELFPEFQIPIKKQKFYRNDTFLWQNYIWFPVKTVTFEKYKGKVYDLTVEKDSSYVANGITVHNSVGGSLVAYLAGITNINPLQHKLLFQRFLNEERIAMPDIDLDFADTRRDEVIQYISQKYGQDRVAQIITFGTMAARAAVRDVGRVLGYAYGYCDKVAKAIPMGFTLNQTLKQISEFRALYESDDKMRRLIDLSKKLEGVARHASTHACGVVISAEPLGELVPLQHPTQNIETIITQYEMYSIEDLGLLKIDLLGLKNLTIIEKALNLIEKLHNKKIDIDNIPKDDKKTYKLLQKAETVSVFQLESDGMRKWLGQLQLSNFEDIVAMVALYRPGPMQFIPEYVARKKKKKKIEYIHPKLKPILESTYGVCIFQEQLMQIAQTIAGFSLSEADVLRKAVGKKIVKLLREQKEKFISGAIKQNTPQEIAEKIWNWFLPFARYAFNAAHATGYATIAYQTAYLKANYPVEFMAAVFASEKQDVERIAYLIEECKRMGIKVLPPDINESFANFTVVEKNQIRFGLLAIKNVGHNVVASIVLERKNNGKFQSITDFINRINCKDLNKKSMEALTKVGAFDKLEERAVLLGNMERLLSFSRELHNNKKNGQVGLFDNSNINPVISLSSVSPANSSQKLKWEKELLGLYISGHPLEKFRKAAAKKTIPISKIYQDLSKDEERSGLPLSSIPGPFFKKIMPGNRVKIFGLISKIKKIITKSGRPMFFITIEDLTGKIESIVFPNTAEQNSFALKKEKIVLLSGRVDLKDNVPKFVAESIEELVAVTE